MEPAVVRRERDLRPRQRVEARGQRPPLAAVHVAGAVGRVGPGPQESQLLAAGHRGEPGPQSRSEAEVLVLDGEAQVHEAEPVARAPHAPESLAQVGEERRRREEAGRVRARGALAGRLGPQPLARLDRPAQLGGRLLEHVGEGRRRVGRVDRGRELLEARPQLGARPRRVLPHPLGVAGFGAAVDLRPQPGEARVEVGEGGRFLPDLLHRRRLAAVRQEPGGPAQRGEAVAGPLGARRHREQQVAGPGPLVLLLHGAAVEPRAAEDPAVVDRHEVLLDEDLPELVDEAVPRERGLGVDPGEDVPDEIALAAQGLGLRAPLAVLDAAAPLGAGERHRRLHRAVLAEPADLRERSPLGRLHLLDPGRVGGGVGRRAPREGEEGAGQHARAECGHRQASWPSARGWL